MGSGQERRRFKRLQTDWVVRLRRGVASEETRRRIRERITNVSLGGVFIEGGMPFELGSIVEFDFTIPGTRQTIHARGIVRWSNRGQYPNEPIGMGIEFLELSSENREVLRTHIEGTGAVREISRLTRSRLHLELLRLHQRKVGQNLPLAVLAGFLGCTHPALLSVLPDFVSLGLADLQRDTVQFLPVDNSALAEAIQKRMSSPHA